MALFSTSCSLPKEGTHVASFAWQSNKVVFFFSTKLSQFLFITSGQELSFGHKGIKDLVVSLLWLWLQLWRGFDPSPGNFHMKKEKKKKGERKEPRRYQATRLCWLEVPTSPSSRRHFSTTRLHLCDLSVCATTMAPEPPRTESGGPCAPGPVVTALS